MGIIRAKKQEIYYLLTFNLIKKMANTIIYYKQMKTELNEIMKKNKITYEGISKVIKMSSKTLVLMRKGKAMNIENYYKLSNAFYWILDDYEFRQLGYQCVDKLADYFKAKYEKKNE